MSDRRIQMPMDQEFDAHEVEGHGEGNPLKTLHGMLAGRYWVAILLAAVGVGIGAPVGYYARKPTYTSNGLLHIIPVLPKVLYATEDKSGVMPMFDSFVGSQMALLKSQRVVDMAMQSDGWRAYGRGASSEAIADFDASVAVTRLPESELVKVSFTDRSADASQDAVRSVIAAYQKLFVETDSESENQRLKTLEEYRDKLSNEMKDKERELQADNDGLGPDAIEQMRQFKLLEVREQEGELKEAQKAIAEAQGAPAQTQPAAGTAAGATSKPAADMTVDEIAATDQGMAQLVGTLNQKKAELALLQKTSSMGARNPEIVNRAAALDLQQQEINEYAENFRKLHPAGLKGPDGTIAAKPADIEKLKAHEQTVEAMYNQAKGEAEDLAKKADKIEAIKSDVADVSERLEETKNRIEQINLESTVSGRVSVISNGDRPVINDPRVKLASAGGFLGAMLGFGAILLVGLFDRRVRNVDNARLGLGMHLRFLGILPSLPGDIDDPEAAATVVTCVHHIRTLLQVSPQLESNCAIAVTSPSAGDGKTSLTLSLGLSFAASKARTLLIDADAVGAGLTHRFRVQVRRQLGEMMVRRKLVTREQLAGALTKSQESGRKLGRTVIEAGMVEKEIVKKLLVSQMKSCRSLFDVLSGEPLERCVTPTFMEGMYILPMDSAMAQQAGTISPAAMRRLLEEAKKHFDVILVDTGPVPGSIEASVVASQVDGVVLMVSRNEQRTIARRAAEHLESVGASLLGVVFNRAQTNDLNSSYGVSFSTRNVSALNASMPPEKQPAKYGPVVSAMAMHVSGSEDEKDRNGHAH